MRAFLQIFVPLLCILVLAANVPASAQDFDWGDAPDQPTNPLPFAYQTLQINNGANHQIFAGSPFMGVCVDGEINGQPSINAIDDDNNMGAPVIPAGIQCTDDEDGVSQLTPFFSGFPAVVAVDMIASPSACVLNAWLDTGPGGVPDGKFDPTDQIFINVPLAAGVIHNLNFLVAPGLGIMTTYARFRCSTNGNDPPDGPSPDGEVEDYAFGIEGEPGIGIDWGDAPDQPTNPGFNYLTLAANIGASHPFTIPGSPFMGQCVDGEQDGQPTIPADGDDLGGSATVIGLCATRGDDEDGVTLTTPLYPGVPASVAIDMTGSFSPCVVNAWLDTGPTPLPNGAWDATDQIITDLSLAPGVVHNVGFLVPAATSPGVPAYARFRCSTLPGLQPGGRAQDGEVEDYQFFVEDSQEDFDWGDAPDQPTNPLFNYKTLAINLGPVHIVTGNPILGNTFDSEPDGQPTALSDGDDLNGIGLPGDEDGLVPPVTFDLNNPPVTLNVISSTGGQIDAWVDWNKNMTFDAVEYWSGPGGLPFPHPGGGGAVMTFTVPVGTTAGMTHMRLRISRNGGLPPTGFGFDGEVEDYMLDIKLPVELEDFGAQIDGDDVVLTWTTASEIDNVGFGIEHAGEADVFRELAFVERRGDALERTSYTYHVADVDPGLHRFRLRLVDADGSAAYSSVVEIHTNMPAAFVLEPAYPNPFNAQATVRFAVRDENPISLHLLDLNGRIVRTVYEGLPDAGRMMSASADADGLASGVYLVRLKGADFVACRKLVLLK